MKPTLAFGIIGLLAITLSLGAQTPEKKPDKKPPLPGGDPDSIVTFLLKQFDKNMDQKLSKDEVRGKIADGFAKLDTNGDSFLDRAELRVVARGLADQKKGPGFGPFGGFGQDPNDFDGHDKDADGRLTRDEMKGTRWAPRFDEIDANMDGRLDRREWEAYQRKSAEKKKE